MSGGKLDFAAFGLDPVNPDPVQVFTRLFQSTFEKLISRTSVSKKEWQDLFSNFHRFITWLESGDHEMTIRQIFSCMKLDMELVVKDTAILLDSEEDHGVFLQKYAKCWREFEAVTTYAHLPFSILDSALLELLDFAGAKSDELKPVQRMMMQVWHEVILKPFTQRLLKIVGDQLNSYRDEGVQIIYGDQIVAVRDSFYLVSQSTKVFEESYEQVYLSHMTQFYGFAAAMHFENGGVVDYAKWAEQAFRTEQSRAEKYLVPSAKYQVPLSRMHEKLVDILIKDPKIYDAIVAEACRLTEDRRSEPLGVLYRLLDRVPSGLDPVIESVRQYIVRKGKEDMLEAAAVVVNDPEKYVEKLLSLFNSFSKLITDAFADDHRFTSARDKGFQDVVNDTSIFQLQLNLRGRPAAIESRCPDMLATFCDSLLRKTTHSRRLSSEEISQRLKQTIQVLKYINSRDIFIHMYQTNLGRRLILGLSVDSDLEEEMSKWLAGVGMPADVMNRINRMFSDMRVSEDLCREWRENLANCGTVFKVPDVTPSVLNVCSWARPAMDRVCCALTPDIEEFNSEFEKWYCNKFNGRKIFLVGSASHMTIQFISNIGVYDLEVTMFQMSVMRAFQQCGRAKLTFDALQMATALPANELRRVLWGLCTISKCGNLVIGHAPKATSLRDFNQSSRFWLNMNFAPIKGGKPQKRGRVNLIGKLQISSERSPEDEADGITELREFRVQEAITKLMKARKTATMAEIHTETIEILKNLFLPNRKVLKEQIEFLIEKEYLSRDERDLNTFHYLA